MLTRLVMVLPVTGCMIGVGPSIAVRATGPHAGVSMGFEDELLLEPAKFRSVDMPVAERHPWLVGFGNSISIPMTSDSSDVRFVSLYGKGMGSFSALHDTRAAAMAAGSVGATFARSSGQSIDATQMIAASGGVLEGVHCSGRSFSVELGVRWVNRGIELFLTPRVNYLFRVGTPDGQCTLGGVR